MDQFSQELEHLTSLLSRAVKQHAPSTLVSKETFLEYQQFFQIDQPLQIQQPVHQPLQEKKPPLPTPKEHKPIQTAPKEPPAAKPSPPVLPITVEEEPVIPPISERVKKQERFLPIPCTITKSDISKIIEELPNHLCSEKNLFLDISKPLRWGYTLYGPASDELISLTKSITEAIKSKLGIPLSHFNTLDEQFLLRLRAASTELTHFLVFGEAHSESTSKKHLQKIHEFTEEALSSYPQMLFLGTIHQMHCYFIPLSISMKEDLQTKKKLWTSLQTLAKKR